MVQFHRYYYLAQVVAVPVPFWQKKTHLRPLFSTITVKVVHHKSRCGRLVYGVTCIWWPHLRAASLIHHGERSHQEVTELTVPELSHP